MIIYGINGLESGDYYLPSARKAIAEARSYGPQAETGLEVIAYDIGKLDKAKACALASGSSFAIRQRDIWPKRGEWNR